MGKGVGLGVSLVSARGGKMSAPRRLVTSELP
jgi:hypothetical protein